MDFSFVAAQRLVCVGEAHRAAKLHGHTFRMRVTLAGETDPRAGWLIDPAELRRAVEEVLIDLDHRYLNEVPGLDNPSTEALCLFVRDRLTRSLDGAVTVEIWENPEVGCVTPPARH